MSARQMLLSVGVCFLGLTAATGCSAVVGDSGPSTTLPPLGSTTADREAGAPDESSPTESAPLVDDAAAAATAVPTTITPTTAMPAITTTIAPATTTSTTTSSTTSTSTTTAVAPTVTPPLGLVDGVSATIAGRSLSFSSACRDGQNVVLDGVTWSFAGNSFRFDATAADDRSAAVLIGDGFTMPMLVSSVQDGVYTYIGSPVADSVSSAMVEVDHGALPIC